jgi:hypothetical protein
MPRTFSLKAKDTSVDPAGQAKGLGIHKCDLQLLPTGMNIEVHTLTNRPRDKISSVVCSTQYS